ncbi:hypothetical protein IU11_05825 [Cellulosimicrobium sp. MM]|nr:hypothetical protein IU11_05825 [Cellulosimicrobium sp. MM]
MPRTTSVGTTTSRGASSGFSARDTASAAACRPISTTSYHDRHVQQVRELEVVEADERDVRRRPSTRSRSAWSAPTVILLFAVTTPSAARQGEELRDEHACEVGVVRAVRT